MQERGGEGGLGFKKRVEKEMRPWWDEKRVVLQKKKRPKKRSKLGGGEDEEGTDREGTM